jgi:hypothetical protein
MIQLVLSGILLMATLAEAGPLLRLEKRSGHTLPQNALLVQCELSESGTEVIGQRFEGINSTGEWDRQIEIQRPVSETELQTLNQWIAEAANGPFWTSKNPCDVGTEIIKTSTYRLRESLDCGRRIENQHPSAIQLIAWLRQACTLTRKKP